MPVAARNRACQTSPDRARGVELPLEVHDGDGLLDSTTEVRFYAQPSSFSSAVGDRWNLTETDWLTVDASPALRMQTA